jgi:hypothetical protein
MGCSFLFDDGLGDIELDLSRYRVATIGGHGYALPGSKDRRQGFGYRTKAAADQAGTLLGGTCGRAVVGARH